MTEDLHNKQISDVCLRYETGRGFFEGVCAAGHRLPFSCDPPPPCHSRVVTQAVSPHS